MTAIIAEVKVACRSDVARLWSALADTDRTNRVLGNGRLNVEPLRGPSAARFLVTTRVAGFKVQHEERPFEWVYPQRFRIVRPIRTGPLDELDFSMNFNALAGGGADVGVRIAATPRYRVLSPVIRLMMNKVREDFRAYIERVDAALAAGRPDRAGPPRSAVQAATLARAEASLRAAEKDRRAIVDRLVAHVAEADEIEASRLRPFELADAWGEDRTAVLGVCLSAVRAGLLTLRWELICPSCLVATDVLPSLGALAEHGACQLCDLDFSVDLEDAVEATFAPAPAVREIDVGPYCVGGPARTPHVFAQAILPPRGDAALPAPAEEGRYRLFVRGGSTAPVEIAAGAPAEARITADKAGKQGPIAIAPAGRIVVENPSAEETHAKLERIITDHKAARARMLAAIPAFRRDFSGDVLRPGLALKIARVCLFFSDLTGSTQLYADAGDAAAFKLVQDHFEVVIGLLEKHQGTLVKTIGDAVMAAFADDLDALLASIAILSAFDTFRAQGGWRAETHIKLGVFGGSCYVVTANGVLDYFGQTVNIAARLQGEARSGELVVEEALADQAIALKAIPASYVVERYDARPKGVPAPIRVARIRVSGS